MGVEFWCLSSSLVLVKQGKFSVGWKTRALMHRWPVSPHHCSLRLSLFDKCFVPSCLCFCMGICPEPGLFQCFLTGLRSSLVLTLVGLLPLSVSYLILVRQLKILFLKFVTTFKRIFLKGRIRMRGGGGEDLGGWMDGWRDLLYPLTQCSNACSWRSCARPKSGTGNSTWDPSSVQKSKV